LCLRKAARALMTGALECAHGLAAAAVGLKALLRQVQLLLLLLALKLLLLWREADDVI